MSLLVDPDYLRQSQYQRSNNLCARIDLHSRFGTNSEDWFHWLRRQISIRPQDRVLDVGCGTCRLWSDRTMENGREKPLIFGDLSFGMASEAARTLGSAFPAALFCGDVQNLPFSSVDFDVVIANHMLYHVKNLDRGISEISRVLRPGGRLYSSTNGRRNMEKLFTLLRDFNNNYLRGEDPAERFGLECAADLLGGFFREVEVRNYEDILRVTEAPPLVAYIFSSPLLRGKIDIDRRAALTHYLDEIIAREGAILIPKSSGLVTGIRG